MIVFDNLWGKSSMYDASDSKMIFNKLDKLST